MAGIWQCFRRQVSPVLQNPKNKTGVQLFFTSWLRCILNILMTLQPAICNRNQPEEARPPAINFCWSCWLWQDPSCRQAEHRRSERFCSWKGNEHSFSLGGLVFYCLSVVAAALIFPFRYLASFWNSKKLYSLVFRESFLKCSFLAFLVLRGSQQNRSLRNVSAECHGLGFCIYSNSE